MHQKLVAHSRPAFSGLLTRTKARQQPMLHHGQGPARQQGARFGRQVVVAAALNNESGGWGDVRPDWLDTCLDQDAPGSVSDLDAEWQAFIAGSGRYQQPQPLIWNADSGSGRQPLPFSSSSSSSNSSSSTGDDVGATPSTSNRGPDASCSNRYTSSIQSFDDWDFAEDDFAIPVPCNLPVNEASMHSHAGGSASMTSTSSTSEQLWPAVAPHPCTSRDLCTPADLLTSRSLLQSLREVYVLLFGVGQKDTEGIYSLRAVSDDGLPTETIIAFENMEDAIRYAALLEATMEHCPNVCSIPPTELMAFCGDSGYRCRLELEGSLLMPPDYNVHITDWERSLRLREGKFHVLPEEPDFSHAADAPFQAGSRLAAAAGLPATSSSPANSANGSQLLLRHSDFAAQFTAAQLDTLKAQLESLLPASPADSHDE